jgi:hypothetical protein
MHAKNARQDEQVFCGNASEHKHASEEIQLVTALSGRAK